MRPVGLGAQERREHLLDDDSDASRREAAVAVGLHPERVLHVDRLLWFLLDGGARRVQVTGEAHRQAEAGDRAARLAPLTQHQALHHRRLLARRRLAVDRLRRPHVAQSGEGRPGGGRRLITRHARLGRPRHGRLQTT